MDSIQAAREQRKFRKLRTLKTVDYFCRLCGQSDWRFRYEQHHIGHKKYSPELIWLCINCHDWISDMQRDEFPIPNGVDADTLEVVMLLKGHAELHERSAVTLRRALHLLLGRAAANDNGEGGK